MKLSILHRIADMLNLSPSHLTVLAVAIALNIAVEIVISYH